MLKKELFNRTQDYIVNNNNNNNNDDDDDEIN